MASSPNRSGMISLSLGAVFLLASNLMGHGVCIKPDPRGALLLAAAGVLFFVLAHTRAERWRQKVLRVLQLVLALGTFSVVAGLLVCDLQEFHRTARQDWGATPPPQLIFSATYAVASLLALLGISISARQRSVSTTELPLAAD